MVHEGDPDVLRLALSGEVDAGSGSRQVDRLCAHKAQK